jgi:hypothetical protein
MTAPVAGAIRGRPSNSALSDRLERAQETIRRLRENLQAQADESVDFALDVRIHGRRLHYATLAERPDIALHEAAAIVDAAERHLRQRGRVPA